MDCTPVIKVVIAMSRYGNESLLPMPSYQKGSSFLKTALGAAKPKPQASVIEKRSGDLLFFISSRSHCLNLEELTLVAPLLLGTGSDLSLARLPSPASCRYSKVIGLKCWD